MGGFLVCLHDIEMNNTDQSNRKEKEPQEEEARDLLLRLGQLKAANLKLSIRNINILARAGIITIADLIPLDRHDLFLIPGIGEQCFIR
jgi:DNA-directed RNA polymerase alpha subunit